MTWVRDISGIKKAEDALREGEAFLKDILSTTREGFCLLDLQGNLVEVNEAYGRMTGYPVHELLKMNLRDLDAVENSEEARAHIAKVMAVGHDHFFTRHRRKDGSEVPLEVSTSLSSRGEKRFVCFIHDLTRRQQVEDELRMHQEIFLNISEALYLVRLDGIIVYTNAVFERMFGYGKDELLGRHVSALNAPADGDPRQTAEAITRQLVEDGVWKGEVLNIRKDGTLFHSYATISVFDHSRFGRVAVNLHTDITERKKYEATIQEQNAALKAYGANKDRLLSIVAHDLRGSFQQILGYVDLLSLKSDALPAEANGHLRQVQKSARRALKVFEDLLLWARADSGTLGFEPRKQGLFRVCHEALEAARSDAALKQIRVLGPSAGEVELSFDARMVQLILRNLLANAVKFTPSKGAVSLALDPQAHQVVVSISDTGVGIEANRLARLWGAEFIESTPGSDGEKGSGLGLLLCRDFVEKHGGRIWAESVPGRGSAFHFTLPRLRD